MAETLFLAAVIYAPEVLAFPQMRNVLETPDSYSDDYVYHCAEIQELLRVDTLGGRNHWKRSRDSHMLVCQNFKGERWLTQFLLKMNEAISHD